MKMFEQSQTGLSLSASNVEQYHLIKHYNWVFVKEFQDLNHDSKDAFANIRSSHLDYEKISASKRALKIPENWQNPPGGDMVSLTRTLTVQLESVISGSETNSIRVEVSSRNVIEKLPSSEPNIIPFEMKPNDDDQAHGISGPQWILLRARCRTAHRFMFSRILQN
ncbi:hypothetical protein K439DRAFT_43276 [Ramaria rubella]|nr:hypothetical protein K439DRAFT_43276 [Ramaria rubella]